MLKNEQTLRNISAEVPAAVFTVPSPSPSPLYYQLFGGEKEAGMTAGKKAAASTLHATPVSSLRLSVAENEL